MKTKNPKTCVNIFAVGLLLAVGCPACVTAGGIADRKQVIEAQIDAWAKRCSDTTISALESEKFVLSDSDRTEIYALVGQGARRVVPSLKKTPCEHVPGARISPFSEPNCLVSAQNEANNLDDKACDLVTKAAIDGARKQLAKDEKRRAASADSASKSEDAAPKNDCRNFNQIEVRGQLEKGSYRIEIPVGREAGGECVRYSQAQDTCLETASKTAYVSAIFVTNREFKQPGPAFQIFAKYVGEVPQKQANGFQVQVPKYVENAACRDELSH